MRVLADLFGMPREDRHLIFEWSNALLGADDPSAPQHADDAMPAMAEMMDYGQAMAVDRRAPPRDDLVSRIVTAEVDGERLTDNDFQMFWLLLVVAGNETTRDRCREPWCPRPAGRWTWLSEHPEHLATAVDELLRHVSPVQQFRRTATRDTVLGDQRVREGDKVVMWFGAANRDPAVFADPHGLDLLRDPNPHLAFGAGPISAWGAPGPAGDGRDAAPPAGALAGPPGGGAGAGGNFINGISHLPVTAGAASAMAPCPSWTAPLAAYHPGPRRPDRSAGRRRSTSPDRTACSARWSPS